MGKVGTIKLKNGRAGKEIRLVATLYTPEVISELGKADERNLYELTPSTTQENFPVSYYQLVDPLLKYQ